MILLAAIVVVDPKREHSIIEKRYKLWGTELEESCTTEPCFLDEAVGYARARFFQELKDCEEQMPTDGIVYQIQNIVARIMVTNATEILTNLHDALDEIDLSLSRDDILRNSLHIWRERFGLWRQDLLHTSASIKDILQTFEQQKLCPTCAPQPPSSLIPKHEVDLAGLRDDFEETLARLTSTFQAVMSTMSIIESQKAIAEAETVSKLTALAFFFIPLSFIASLFGMNLIVSLLLSINVSDYHQLTPRCLGIRPEAQTLDVDYSLSKCHNSDIQLPLHAHNNNSRTKNPPILSKPEPAKNKCWSCSLEPYPHLRSPACFRSYHAFLGCSRAYGRNGRGLVENLHVGSVERSKGWNNYCDFFRPAHAHCPYERMRGSS